MTDPYGHANDAYQADPWFADYFCAAMGQTMSRFEGCRPLIDETLHALQDLLQAHGFAPDGSIDRQASRSAFRDQR